MNRYSALVWVFAVAMPLCGQTSSPSKPAPPAATAVEPGEISGGVYHNPSFGFTCKIPYGWVDRTPEMREASTDAKKEMVLLGVFQRPPEATGSTVNSTVVIVAESTSSYPGLKDAAQYFGPLGEIMTTNGVAAVNEPYEFPVDAKPVVRRDFIKQLGSGSMHQSTLVWLAKGYAVSFTFIAGNEEEVTGLVEGLAFAKKPAARK